MAKSGNCCSRKMVKCLWNVMAHAQKPDFVFRRNEWDHLNLRRRQFSRLLAAEVCASAVVMLDTPLSDVMWRVLATHSIHQFLLHFPTLTSPCAIRFQTHSTRAAALQIVAMFLLQEVALSAQYIASSPVYVFHHASSGNAPERHSLREGCWTC